MYPNSYAYPPANGAEQYGYSYNSYGAPGYPTPTPSFPGSTPAVGTYGASVPAPEGPAALSNPTSFERMYRGQLAQLTFNSKPIITNLTLIAQEHMHRMSTLVAKLIDAHIITAPPAYRLPSMYLLDSISKNIGSPYTELWAPRVATLFLESYRVVDQPTKRRLEELLATWRVAGPDKRPLFGDAAQQGIERALFGSAGGQPKQAQPTQSQVLANIERLLALKAQERSRNPGDESVGERMQTLRELREKVQDSEPIPELLAEVQKELDAIANKRQTTPAVATPPPAAAPTPSAAPTASASELIANLMRAGLLPSAQAVPAAAAAVVPVPTKASQDKAYTDYILSLDLRLTTLDLSRQPPELELVVQENLPLPCRQCANRYPDGVAGKNGLDYHLDWHFSQNRRARASMARGQSRSWLDPVARWVRSGFDDVTEHNTNEESGAVISPAQEQALKEKFANTYVVVPDDPEIAARPCRICKEKFQSEWSEDVEEWIWKNAVEIDGAYLHASCYYSAKSMSESVKGEAEAPAKPVVAPLEAPRVEAEAPQATPIKEEDGLKEEDAATLKRKASPAEELPQKKVASDEAPAASPTEAA